MDGIGALVKEDPESSLSLLPYEVTVRRCHLRYPLITEISHTLILDFSVFRTEKLISVVCKSPSLWCSLTVA